MDDFIELGIEGVDKLVDKGFHKVPDRALHVHNPNKRKARQSREGDRNRARDTRDQDADPDQDRRRRRSLDDDRTRSEPYYGGDSSYQYADQPSYDPNSQYYSPPVMGAEPSYSGQQVARERPRYAPPVSGYASDDYSPPRRSTRDRDRGRRYSDDGEDYNDSSYLSSRGAESSRDRPRSSGDTGIKKVFSDSDKGLASGAIGAVAGGLLAYEAGKSNRKRDPWLATLLGAAIGGLGANALEKQYQKKKEGRVLEEERWERKFGGGDGGRNDDRY